MTVRELQAFLSKQRPDADVVVRDPQDSGAVCVILSIEVEEPFADDDVARVIVVVG